MIEKRDGEFELIRGSFPQFIAFTEDSKVIGKLWLKEPMRFEGDTKKSARIFFENVVALNNETIIELTKLLRVANCPECVDGSGSYAKEIIGFDGEADIEEVQCQFCYERNLLLGDEQG